MDTKGRKLLWGGDGGVLNLAIGIDMYTLMCIKLMTNKDLQYKNKQTKKQLMKNSTIFLCWFEVNFFDSQTQEPDSPSRRLHAPTAEARKPKCQGTMSMHTEVSKEGFNIFFQVLSHN